MSICIGQVHMHKALPVALSTAVPPLARTRPIVVETGSIHLRSSLRPSKCMRLIVSALPTARFRKWARLALHSTEVRKIAVSFLVWWKTCRVMGFKSGQSIRTTFQTLGGRRRAMWLWIALCAMLAGSGWALVISSPFTPQELGSNTIKSHMCHTLV